MNHEESQRMQKWISCDHVELKTDFLTVCPAGELNMALVSEFLGQLTLSYGGVSKKLKNK